MALPPPQSRPGLPAPQSTAGLPVSDAAQSPLFGMYPEEQGLVGMGASGLSIAESVSSYAQSPLGQMMHQRQLALLQAQGIPLDGDPNAWSPDEAAAQTDAAIAKIATVNPDLAEQLLANREGEGEDKGFFDQLKELAGDIIAPVAAIGGKALDLLSRPARIIPELLSDREDDPWYEDIGQALSGNSSASWSRVLDDWGVENGLIRAVGGFALDVATDPLSYLTFGMAGVGRGVAARVASATVARSVGREALEGAASKGLLNLGGRSLDDFVTHMYDDLTRPGRNILGGTALDPDAAAAIAGRTLAGAEREAATQMLTAADRVHRMVTTVGLANMPKELALSAGRKLTKDEVYGILNAGMRGAASPTKRALAGSMGGMRFRFAVPFTDLRYMSPALPGTAKLNFQVARRFTTGMAGMTKLMHAIDTGAASWDDFARWADVDGGYRALLREKPDMANVLRSRGGSFGSALYSVSDSLGSLTSHMSPHAQVLRGGGILGQMAADWNVVARGWEEDLLAQGWNHTDAEGVVTDRTALMDAYGKNIKAERLSEYTEYLELFPNRKAAADVDAFLAEAEEAGTLRLPRGLEGSEREAAMARLRERARELDTTISESEKDVLWKLRELQDQMRDVADREGANILDTTLDLDGAASLNAADASRWNQHSRPDTRDLEFIVESGDGVGVDAARRNWQGFNVEDKVPTMGLGSGVHATAVREGTLPPVSAPKAEAGYVYHATRSEFLDGIRTMGLDPAKARGSKKSTFFSKDPASAADLADTAAGFDTALLRVRSKGRNLEPIEGEDILTSKDSVGPGDIEMWTGADWSPLNAVDQAIPPTRARIRLRKAATVGNTPGGTMNDQALLDELYAEATEVAQREVGQKSAQLGNAPAQVGKAKTKVERMAAALDIPEVDQRADELVTEALRKRGYDGIVRYEEDGGISATVFDPHNVKRLSDDAPNVVAGRGYVPRVMTEQAQQFLDGKLPEEELTRFIYGSPKMHHDVSRKFADLPIDEAEREVRNVLRGRGYNIPDDMPIFERDLLRVHDKYVHRLTTHVMHESAGYTAGRMAYLTEMAPGLLGGVAGTTRYSWRMSELSDDVLEKLPGRVRVAVEKTERANRKALKSQFLAAQAAEQSLVRVRAALEGQLDLGGKAGSASAAARASSGAMGRDVAAIQASLDTALGQWRDVLRKQKSGLVDAETFKGLQVDLAERMKSLRTELAAAKKGQPKFAVTAGAQRKAAQAGGDLFEQEAKRVAQAQRRADRVMRHLSDAIEEQNRTVAAYKMNVAKAKPALVPTHEGKNGFVQLQVNGMEDFAMPAYIAQEFHSILDKGRGITGLHKEYRKVLQAWKGWATFRWPGFHVRNFQGATFNNLIGGVNAEDYHMSLRLRRAYAGHGAEEVVPAKVFDTYALGRIFRGRKGDLTYGEWVTRVNDMGISSKNHGSLMDVRTTTEAIEAAVKRGGKRSIPRKALDKYDQKLARPATELTENFHRTAAFLGGLRQTGGDFHGARAFTMMRHGDYADLTPWEANFVKDVIPFYKWLRTNLPYQFRQLLENPGVPLGVEKARQAAVSQLSDEQRAAMPEWQRDAFNIPMPDWAKRLTGAELLTLDLPNSDLHQGAREFFSSFLPLVRPAAEAFILEKDTFTGRPVEGEMVESVIGGLPVVSHILEAVGLGKRNAEGKLMVSDKVDRLFTTIPIYSRVRHFLYSDPERVEKRANALFSMFLGTGLNQLDDESLTKAELSFYYDEVEPLMNMYRDLGVQFPTKDDLDPSVFYALGLEAPAAA